MLKGNKYLLFSLQVKTGYIDDILESSGYCENLEVITWLGTLENYKPFIVQDGKVMRVGEEQ